MLLTERPHFKNHWPRPLVWNNWHEYSDQWSASFLAETYFVRDLSVVVVLVSLVPTSIHGHILWPQHLNLPLMNHSSHIVFVGMSIMVFPLTLGHTVDAWSKPRRGLAII